MTTTDVITSLYSLDTKKLFFIGLFICIVTVTILMTISTGLVKLFSKLKDALSNIESIGIGKFSLKTRKKCINNSSPLEIANNQDSNTKELDINLFINILNIIFSNEIKTIVHSTVNIMKEINIIDQEYDKNIKTIFAKNFSKISNELHNCLISFVSEKIDKSLVKDLKNTREYLFVSSLMDNYKQAWLNQSEEIIKRNGFVDLKTDKIKCDNYIYELNNCIFQCIDMYKLDSTSLLKSEIDTIIMSNMEYSKSIITNMLMNLADIKIKMLEKRKAKFDSIEDSAKAVMDKILVDFKEKLFVNYLDDDDETDNENNKE